MKVRNLEGIRGRAIVNQFVIDDGRKTTFQSYDSVIIEIDRECQKITVGRDWDYSITTIKCLKIFLKETLWWSDEAVLEFKKKLKKAQSSGNNEFVYDGFSVIYDKDLR